MGHRPAHRGRLAGPRPSRSRARRSGPGRGPNAAFTRWSGPGCRPRSARRPRFGSARPASTTPGGRSCGRNACLAGWCRPTRRRPVVPPGRPRRRLLRSRLGPRAEAAWRSGRAGQGRRGPPGGVLSGHLAPHRCRLPGRGRGAARLPSDRPVARVLGLQPGRRGRGLARRSARLLDRPVTSPGRPGAVRCRGGDQRAERCAGSERLWPGPGEAGPELYRPGTAASAGARRPADAPAREVTALAGSPGRDQEE